MGLRGARGGGRVKGAAVPLDVDVAVVARAGVAGSDGPAAARGVVGVGVSPAAAPEDVGVVAAPEGVGAGVAPAADPGGAGVVAGARAKSAAVGGGGGGVGASVEAREDAVVAPEDASPSASRVDAEPSADVEHLHVNWFYLFNSY